MKTLADAAEILSERSHGWWQLYKKDRSDRLVWANRARSMSDEMREIATKIERLQEEEKRLLDSWGSTIDPTLGGLKKESK